MNPKKIICITMGCPSGVGPEIIVKAAAEKKIKFSETIIFGDFKLLYYYIKLYNLNLKINIIQNFDKKTILSDSQLNLLDFNNCCMSKIKFGEVSAESGKASLDYIVSAVDNALKKNVSAIVTCPINKDALHKAGSLFPGHTELLGHLTGSKNFGMMLVGKYLRVLLVTTHIGIKKVPEKISVDSVFKTIMLADTSLKSDFAVKKPKIAVLSLNPHCGENGLFGQEEIKYIKPAVDLAKKKHVSAEGPFSPDTLFPKVKNNFDCVVCMYHDQGLIPLKLISFGTGVNITIGLPITRTSVDHGTAYDIVGKNKAHYTSLTEAVRHAKLICSRKL
ncbi:4-hydroxythreonine-4-phosphate dehydrogenase PdxA [Candidatus Dependentiae bacterium]|nr:4-hydroxythreonine-4-phosphate dehydrogenase PdxA [Candidatus Dependentiae bacterium]